MSENIFDTQPLDREQALAMLGDDWKESAPRVIGIPVHPSGEMSVFEHLHRGPSDLASVRLRYRGISLHGVIHAIALFIFVCNIIRMIRFLRRNVYYLTAWCCTIQALSGTIYALLDVTTRLFTNGISCRELIWTGAIGITVSSICTSVALLQRAYLAHSRNKKLLILGIIMMIPLPTSAYITMISPAVLIPGSGCTLLYPSILPWIKFAIEAPINTVFSVAFIMVVYQQYQLYGAKAWRRLTYNGIRTLGLIIICNLICMLAAGIDALGIISVLFFLIDWVIVSSLLVNYCFTMAAAAATSNTAHSKRPTFDTMIDSLPRTDTTDTSALLSVTYQRSNSFISRTSRRTRTPNNSVN